MKIKRPTSPKKILIIATVALLTVVGCYLGIAAAYKLYPFQAATQLDTDKKINDVNYDKPTKEQENAPTEITEDSSKTSGGVGSDKLPTGNIGVVITSSQIDPSGNLRIGTILQIITNEGQCQLIVKKGTQEIASQTAGVQPMSNASTCQGFTVMADKLPSGTYTVSVSYSNGSAKGNDESEVVVP